MARRRKRRRAARGRWVLLVLPLVVAVIAGYLWGRRAERAAGLDATVEAVTTRKEPASPTVTRSPDAKPSRGESEVAGEADSEKAPFPRRPLVTVEPGAARIALVIDDLGRRPSDVSRMEALAVDWTAAVLPFESRTAEVVADLRAAGVEFLCHLPMEPRSATGEADPGPGALRAGMTADELARATRDALAAVPGALGVNNHMGSALSADRASMVPILGEIASRGLFFVDSRTSAESVGFRLALELGVPTAERQVFLDADPAADAVAEQFHRLLDVARTRGAALAIGHPREVTFATLEREIPKALAAGFEFVPASYLLERRARDVGE